MEAALRPDGDRPQFIELTGSGTSTSVTEMRPYILTYALPDPVIGPDKDALGPSALQTDAEGYLSSRFDMHGSKD